MSSSATSFMTCNSIHQNMSTLKRPSTPLAHAKKRSLFFSDKRIQVNSPPQHANHIPARKKRVQSQLSLSHSAAENQRCVGIGPDLTAPNRSPKARSRRHLQIAPAVISFEKGTHLPGLLLALVARNLDAGVDGGSGSGSGHCDDSVNGTGVSLAMPLCTEATSSHERVGLVKGLQG